MALGILLSSGLFFAIFFFVIIIFSSTGDLQNEEEILVITKEVEEGTTFEVGRIWDKEHTELLSRKTGTGGPSQPVSPQQHDPSGFRLCFT